MIRHRQRGQILPLAMFGLIVTIGAVALVVDAGVFFVTQRQLQTAVDAAALAAAWYSPACDPGIMGTACSNTPPPLPPPTWDWTSNYPAHCVANAVLQDNLGFTGGLCGGTPQPPTSAVVAYGSTGLSEYVVTVTCVAPYWFARIFPDMPTMEITASAAATAGFPNASKTDLGQPTPV